MTVTANPVDQLLLMEASRLSNTWDELKSFRETERQRLRAEGVPRELANQQSWELAQQKHPPTLKQFFDLLDPQPSLCAAETRTYWSIASDLAGTVLLLNPCSYDSKLLTLIKTRQKRCSMESPRTHFTDDPLLQKLGDRLYKDGKLIEVMEHTQEAIRQALATLPATGKLANATREELTAWLQWMPSMIELAKSQPLEVW